MNEELECEELVQAFITSKGAVCIEKNLDLAKVDYCFELLKKEVVSQQAKVDDSNLHNKYQAIINQKDDEICIPLKSLNFFHSKLSYLYQKSYFLLLILAALTVMLRSLQNRQSTATATRYFPEGIQTLSKAEQEAFDIFLINYQNKDEVDYYYKILDEKYKCVRREVQIIEECQREIIQTKQSKLSLANNCAMHEKLTYCQNMYKESLSKLEMMENDINALKGDLKNAQLKVIEKFKSWYYKDEEGIKEGGDNLMNMGPLRNRNFCSSPNPMNKFYLHLHPPSAQDKLDFNKPATSIFSVSETNGDDTHSNVEQPLIKRGFSSPFYGLSSCSSCSTNSCCTISNDSNLQASSLRDDLQFGNDSTPQIDDEDFQFDEEQVRKASSNYLNESRLKRLRSNEKSSKPHGDVATSNSSKSYDDVNDSKRFGNSLKNVQAPVSSIVSDEDVGFTDFIKNIKLTGDLEVDDEIVQFYRNKFRKQNVSRV